MKNILLLLLLAIPGLTATAQDKKAEEVTTMIQSQNYVFKARMANPQGGRTRDLNYDYDLTVTPDTITSFLPYFGRAYVAPANPSEGGIKFTSADFDYKMSMKGKGWDITIKPNDAPDVQELYLSIFENGSASLQVISTNRQTISFSGYIKEGREREKKAF